MNKVAAIIRLVSYSHAHFNKSVFLKSPSLVRLNFPQVQHARYFAKNKDKKKEGKGAKKHVKVDETFLSEVINLEKLKEDYDRNVQKLTESFSKYITLRSSLGSIENLPVNFNGKKYRLIELGQVVRKDPKTLTINMRSFPHAIMDALKALSESGMNLNPQQDGTSIYVPVPRVTKEYRDELSKNAKVLFIKCRDNIKDVQNKYLKSLKLKEKQGALSEDDLLEASEQVKLIGDNCISKAQKLLEEKQKELVGEKN